MILFLDFDGVLHPEGVGSDLEFFYLDNFQQLLRQFPSIRVVVSSTWRLSEPLDVLRHYFAPDIRERIVGVTPDIQASNSRRQPGGRQRECEAWIEQNCPQTPWIAIDDRESYFDPGCEHLFLVPHVYDGGVGLDSAQIELLRSRLL